MDFTTFIVNELHILILSAMPIIELRGAIPVAIANGMSPMHAAVISYIGSSLPVPFLLLWLTPVFNWLRTKKQFAGIVDYVKGRTRRKVKNLRALSMVGLALFVAIPLPTTGVWTACVAASMVNMKFRDGLVSILIGNAMAALVVTFGSGLILALIQ